MHIGHIILVKAESHDDAIDRVRGSLNDSDANFAAWSDWSIVGDEGLTGSRYSFHGEFDKWDGASSYAVSLDTEHDKFHKVLDLFYGFREREFNRLAGKIYENTLSGYSLDQDDQDSWELYRYAQLVECQYNPYSFVYDLENYSANLKYFHADGSDSTWYAVLVDFHF